MRTLCLNTLFVPCGSVMQVSIVPIENYNARPTTINPNHEAEYSATDAKRSILDVRGTLFNNS